MEEVSGTHLSQAVSNVWVRLLLLSVFKYVPRSRDYEPLDRVSSGDLGTVQTLIKTSAYVCNLDLVVTHDTYLDVRVYIYVCTPRIQKIRFFCESWGT